MHVESAFLSRHPETDSPQTVAGLRCVRHRACCNRLKAGGDERDVSQTYELIVERTMLIGLNCDGPRKAMRVARRIHLYAERAKADGWEAMMLYALFSTLRREFAKDWPMRQSTRCLTKFHPLYINNYRPFQGNCDNGRDAHSWNYI